LADGIIQGFDQFVVAAHAIDPYIARLTMLKLILQ
jgi:hypothetical protein